MVLLFENNFELTKSCVDAPNNSGCPKQFQVIIHAANYRFEKSINTTLQSETDCETMNSKEPNLHMHRNHVPPVKPIGPVYNYTSD